MRRSTTLGASAGGGARAVFTTFSSPGEPVARSPPARPPRPPPRAPPRPRAEGAPPAEAEPRQSVLVVDSAAGDTGAAAGDTAPTPAVAGAAEGFSPGLPGPAALGLPAPLGAPWATAGAAAAPPAPGDAGSPLARASRAFLASYEEMSCGLAPPKMSGRVAAGASSPRGLVRFWSTSFLRSAGGPDASAPPGDAASVGLSPP